jgi:hypothetical protein
MLKYAPDKFEDRMHFSDLIMQFLVGPETGTQLVFHQRPV